MTLLERARALWDARATRRIVVAGDEAALEFHRGGALTFRGLESSGIIDRPARLPFDERPCYSIPSGIWLRRATSRRATERGPVDFVNWIPVFRGTKKKRGRLNWFLKWFQIARSNVDVAIPLSCYGARRCRKEREIRANKARSSGLTQ